MASKAFDFEIDGVRELQQAFDRIGQAAIRAATASLFESAQLVLTDSKENYVPVDTGTLKNSANAWPKIIKSEGPIEIELGYGGPAQKYAIFVHEINKNYKGGRQWKYLETPLKAAVPAINQKLKDDIDAAIGDVA